MKYLIIYRRDDLSIVDAIENGNSVGGLNSDFASAVLELDVKPSMGSVIPEIQDIVDREALIETRRNEVQANLEALIASLNTAYSIALTMFMTVDEASAILFAAGASWDDCLKLKLLYDTINTMGGISSERE